MQSIHQNITIAMQQKETLNKCEKNCELILISQYAQWKWRVLHFKGFATQ